MGPRTLKLLGPLPLSQEATTVTIVHELPETLSIPVLYANKGTHTHSLFLKNFLMFIFFKERQSLSGAGAEREGDTESEAGSRLRAVSTEPDAGLELPNREIVP